MFRDKRKSEIADDGFARLFIYDRESPRDGNRIVATGARRDVEVWKFARKKICLVGGSKSIKMVKRKIISAY